MIWIAGEVFCEMVFPGSSVTDLRRVAREGSVAPLLREGRKDEKRAAQLGDAGARERGAHQRPRIRGADISSEVKSRMDG